MLQKEEGHRLEQELQAAKDQAAAAMQQQESAVAEVNTYRKTSCTEYLHSFVALFTTTSVRPPQSTQSLT